MRCTDTTVAALHFRLVANRQHFRNGEKIPSLIVKTVWNIPKLEILDRYPEQLFDMPDCGSDSKQNNPIMRFDFHVTGWS